MRNASALKTRPSIEQLLVEQVDQLDRLVSEVSGGIRSPDQFDQLEERATNIAGKLRDAFRRGVQ